MKRLIFILFALLVGCSVSASENTGDLVVIAHRGDNQNAPEHTLLAYEKAVKLGADYIEIDLRMTKDGQLVAIHDESIDRTTNGKGLIKDLTLAEIKKVDSGSWFNPKYKGEKVLTLEEIIREFGNDTRYYIETRPIDNKLIMEDKVLSIIDKYHIEDKVIIQSFSDVSLKKVASLNPDIPLIQLLLEWDLNKVDEKKISEYADGVGPIAEVVSKEFVQRMHSQGLLVHPFFADKKHENELIDKLVSYKIDGIFTDHLGNTIQYK